MRTIFFMRTKATIVFYLEKNMKTHLAIAVILFYSHQDSSSCYTGMISTNRHLKQYLTCFSVNDRKENEKTDALCTKRTEVREKVADESSFGSTFLSFSETYRRY